jgi:integrase
LAPEPAVHYQAEQDLPWRAPISGTLFPVFRVVDRDDRTQGARRPESAAMKIAPYSPRNSGKLLHTAFCDSIFRAALNQAFRDDKTGTDVAWRTVKPFREVDAPRLRYFTKDEVRRLINAAQGDFRDLVKAALFTGCRYGELADLRAADFNRDSGTVFVGRSKSGKARHVVLTEEGRRFFETLTAGRPGDALMLAHADGQEWLPSRQVRPMAEACKAASITGGSFHILRHTAASHLVMGGVPLNVVAHNLGHADTRMTERHYAHLAPSYIAEMIRKFAPTFDAEDDSNIVSIGSVR